MARGVKVYYDGVCGEYTIQVLKTGSGTAQVQSLNGNQAVLHAAAAAGWQFIHWQGVGAPWDGQVLSQNPVFEADLAGEPHHRTVRAVFAEAQHALDLRAALESVIAFSPGARWHTWDRNDNAGNLAPNQIPDGYEFYLLERILVEGSALPVVTQEMFAQVVTAWTSIRADVATALGSRADAAGIDAIAAYLTLGNIGSRAAANYIVSRKWPGSPWSNTAPYGNTAPSAITYLARNQDPDADGFSNVLEYAFAALHYPAPTLRADKYVEAALEPSIPGAGYDPEEVETVTLTITVEGEGTTNLGAGTHTFAIFQPQPGGCASPCPHVGDSPMGCTPCVLNQLELRADASSGWSFHGWLGLPEIHAESQVVVLDRSYDILAEFRRLPAIPDFDAAVLRVFGDLDYDGNFAWYDRDWNVVLDPNGVPEALEFGIIAEILAEPQLDWTARGGVAQETVLAAWSHNLAQARMDWASHAHSDPELPLLTAAYMTLGGEDNYKAALGLFERFAPALAPNMSRSAYDGSQGHLLRPGGDADADGQSNAHEYQDAQAKGLGQPGLACALDPGCQNPTPPEEAAPSPTDPCVDTMIKVTVRDPAVYATSWSGTSVQGVGTVTLSPDGFGQYGGAPPPPGMPGDRWYPVGTEVTLTYTMHDERFGFVSWRASNTEADGVKKRSATFTVRKSTQYFISAHAAQYALGLECHPNAGIVTVQEADGMETNTYPQGHGDYTYDVRRIHFPAGTDVSLSAPDALCVAPDRGLRSGHTSARQGTFASRHWDPGYLIFVQGGLSTADSARGPQYAISGRSTKGGYVSAAYFSPSHSGAPSPWQTSYTHVPEPWRGAYLATGNMCRSQLTGKSHPGYSFSHWQGYPPVPPGIENQRSFPNADGSSTRISDSRLVVYDGQPGTRHRYKAVFHKNVHKLDVQVRLQGESTLDANVRAAGYVRIGDAKPAYEDGDTVTLTATDIPGYQFLHWEGEGHMSMTAAPGYIPIAWLAEDPFDADPHNPLRNPEMRLKMLADSSITAVYAKKDLVVCDAKDGASCLLTVEVEPNVQTVSGNYECMEGREITFTLDTGQIGGCQAPAFAEFKLRATSPDMTYNATATENARAIRKDLTVTMPIVPAADPDHKVRVNVTASVKLGGVTHTQELQIDVFKLWINDFRDAESGKDWKIRVGHNIGYSINASEDVRNMGFHFGRAWPSLKINNRNAVVKHPMPAMFLLGNASNSDFGENTIQIKLRDGDGNTYSATTNLRIFYQYDQIIPGSGILYGPGSPDVPAWFKFWSEALGISSLLWEPEPRVLYDPSLLASGQVLILQHLGMTFMVLGPFIGPSTGCESALIGGGMASYEEGEDGVLRLVRHTHGLNLDPAVGPSNTSDGIAYYWLTVQHELKHYWDAPLGWDSDGDRVSDSREEHTLPDDALPIEAEDGTMRLPVPPPGETYKNIANSHFTTNASGSDDAEYRAYYHEIYEFGNPPGLLDNTRFDHLDWGAGQCPHLRNW